MTAFSFHRTASATSSRPLGSLGMVCGPCPEGAPGPNHCKCTSNPHRNRMGMVSSRLLFLLWYVPTSLDTGNMAIIEIIKNFKWYLYKWFLNGENQIYWNNFQIHSTMQKLSNMIQVQVNILRSLRCHRNFYTIPTENKGPFFFFNTTA